MRLHANLAEKTKQNTFDLVRGIICFCADVFTVSAQNARLLTSFGGGDRRVNLKPPLSIVGSVSACLGVFLVSSAYKDSLCMCTQTQSLISFPTLFRIFTSKFNELRNTIGE